MKIQHGNMAFLILLAVVSLAAAVSPTPCEMQITRQWVAAKFEGAQVIPQPEPGLYVLANQEDVQLNGCNGQPMRLGETEYLRGLCCHAKSKILVRLPGPGQTFTASVGVNNTAAGRGSVAFSVSVKDKIAFQSPVMVGSIPGPMNGYTPAISVKVNLDNAQEFLLEVGDGGDGVASDQADWVDAKVVLADGKTVWLGELPVIKNECQAYDTAPICSFTYGGIPSTELLSTWKTDRSSRKLDDQKTEHTVTYADLKTGLVVRCVGTEFSNFPAVEWVVYFENTGSSDTPILENIQAIDTVLPMPGAGEATLHWSKGGVATFEDFMPQKESLKIDATHHLQGDDGRSSSNVLPFFNIQKTGGGVITAIGWTGNWATDFVNTPKGMLQKAGMMRTHLLLHPGEKIRSPRMLVLNYRGDRWRGQNLLRRFVLAHHRPRLNGKPLVAPITWGNGGGISGDYQLDNIRQAAEHKLPMEYYWIDAGWYGEGHWASTVGNWNVNKKFYPNDFKPLTDELKKRGSRLMLWFEPERLADNSDWANKHRDWIIDIHNNGTCLFNLGIPEARKFVTDFISSKVNEYDIGCYRQDFNMDPRAWWQSIDAPDRQGMAEIRHIEGLYAFWDDLLERHPGLIIDNCASGGRRLDLETIGRATPFWRTDGPRDPVAHQNHTFGLMAWVPLSATSLDCEGDDYEFRSSMCSALCLNWKYFVSGLPRPHSPFPFDWAKHALDEYISLRHLYYGDYYPLTPFEGGSDAFIAWQLDCPEKGEGMVQAFRRPRCIYGMATLKLHGLEPDAVYETKDIDSTETIEATGRELMETGLQLTTLKQPSATIVTYRKK